VAADGTAPPKAQPTTLRPDLTDLFRMISRQPVGARIRLAKLVEDNPEDGQARFLLGLTYHEEKRYSTARTHFDEAERLEPQFPYIYYFRAWGLYYLGELEDARVSFEKHLELMPDEPDSIFGLGLIDMDEDKLDDAERRFVRSIALHREIEKKPNQRPRAREIAKAQVRLSDVHLRRDDLEMAREALEEALQIYPQHYEAWYKLYVLCTRLADNACAERALREHEARKRERRGTAFPE
jgi:Tfp pilus assembly protein PilF